MSNKPLSTDAYKGVRDFYPKDAAIQQYIFDTWRKTAESFGFQQYDASILEPSELYKAKGSQNEEMVNEQTYTFIDRGEREVTLRPEMTPTVARMVAAKARELAFPVRWYSIPNLYRYERPQKGRLREHWQLNCDMFGTSDFTSDIEIIALAYQTLIDFGAKPEHFEIRVNDRVLMTRLYKALGLTDEQIPLVTRLNDRKNKIDAHDYRSQMKEIFEGDGLLVEQVIMMLDNTDEQTDVVAGLAELGITNVVFDKYLARGFDYYTGTIFEIFDVSEENNRALLGGGRYDNLTGMFGGDPISGIGFGMGDVTMRDFLETHNLLPEHILIGPEVVVIPTDAEHNLVAQKVAAKLRHEFRSVSTNIGTKKFNKKIAEASDNGAKYIVIIGEDETESGTAKLKNLESGAEEEVTI